LLADMKYQYRTW